MALVYQSQINTLVTCKPLQNSIASPLIPDVIAILCFLAAINKYNSSLNSSQSFYT